MTRLDVDLRTAAVVVTPTTTAAVIGLPGPTGPPGSGGGGGVTDHGALTGLADDDHTQYAKADGTRGSFATTAQGALAGTASQPGHAHAGTDLTTGTVPTARLGAGTANATTYLRGDQTWAPPAGGGGSDPWTYVIATTQTTNSTTTAVNIAGLSLSGLANGLYEFEAQIRGISAAGATGIQVGMTWGASAPVAAYIWGQNSASSVAFVTTNSAATSVVNGSTGVVNQATNQLAALAFGHFRATSMSHDIVFTVRSEVAASQVSAEPDSFIRYRQIGA